MFQIRPVGRAQRKQWKEDRLSTMRSWLVYYLLKKHQQLFGQTPIQTYQYAVAAWCAMPLRHRP
jgi:hypothetical protein